jgi:hypothetical protein
VFRLRVAWTDILRPKSGPKTVGGGDLFVVSGGDPYPASRLLYHKQSAGITSASDSGFRRWPLKLLKID